MTLRIINQDSILEHALALTREATARVWITSPWITRGPVDRLLRSLVSRDGLDIRIVYRVKEATDLEITDLSALKSLEADGCSIRFSSRVHAKLLLVDQAAAIVSSSNLTATAGYGLDHQIDARNEELGILLEGETSALQDLEKEFGQIWDASTALTEDTLGIVMDTPDVRRFSFVAIRDVHQGAYATVSDVEGHTAIGRVRNVTSHNRSFPALETQGWGSPPFSASFRVKDLPTLFSHPSKEHGFLVTKTVIEPEAMFRIADVEVLKHLESGKLRSPAVPTTPGADVTRASSEILKQLLGEGDIPIGTVLHHPEVQVALRASEILSKHLAVLGMTGAGKSNALKVLIQNILSNGAYKDLRVVIVDTHGEYTPIADVLAPTSKIVDVALRRNILDEDVMKDALEVSKVTDGAVKRLAAVVGRLDESATVATLADALETDLSVGGEHVSKIKRLLNRLRDADDFCMKVDDEVQIVRADGDSEDLAHPGLYILDLRLTDDLVNRAGKTAAILSHVFRRAKETDGNFPTLIVLDEAQNYAPEQHTGWLKEVKPAFDAVFRIASEGRKFGVGLVVSSQRPARLNKDVLSQCNTHIIFRVANVEDLAAIAGSFEAASKPLLDELPGFDTGVCVAGGTAIGMVTRVEVPLFVEP